MDDEPTPEETEDAPEQPQEITCSGGLRLAPLAGKPEAER